MMRKSIITTRKQAALTQKRNLRPLKEDTITKAIMASRRKRTTKKKSNEYHPNKLKRDENIKKVILKPKYESTLVGNVNKRKFSEPRKGALKPSQVPETGDSLSMKELMKDDISLSEEDFLEILTCPSPVWWEESEDECYFDEPIASKKPDTPPPPPVEQKVKEKNENTIEEIKLDKFDKKFIDKRSTFESLLNNLKSKIKTKKGVFYNTRDSKGRFKRTPLKRAKKSLKSNNRQEIIDNNDMTDNTTDSSEVVDSDISDEFYGFKNDSISDSLNHKTIKIANLCNIIKCESITDKLYEPNINSVETDEVVKDENASVSSNSDNQGEAESRDILESDRFESQDTSNKHNFVTPDDISENKHYEIDNSIIKEEISDNDTQLCNEIDNIINDDKILFDNIKVEEVQISENVATDMENSKIDELHKLTNNDECYENIEYLDDDDNDDDDEKSDSDNYTQSNDIMDYLMKSNIIDVNEVTVKAESMEENIQNTENATAQNNDSINDNSNNDTIDESETTNKDNTQRNRETFTKIDLRQAYLSLTQDIR